MRSTNAASLVLGLLSLTACGGAPGEPGEAVDAIDWQIVNGSSDNGDPATVYVSLGGGSCTGTLITPRIILTAKHCTEGVSTSSIEVFFGNNADGPGTWIPATHHQNNPNGESGGPGDLALITMSEAGPATPIPINEKNIANYIGAEIRVVGFGVTGENASDSGTKRMGKTKLASVQSGLIFTGHVGSMTCYGDSGGPNFITIDGNEYVAAATSFGTAACGEGEDGAARTDDALPWIKGYIAAHDPTTPGCTADGQCAMGCPAVDPDCPCAGDGYCTSECADLTSDPDCAGCGSDQNCRLDCPTLDLDCCASDGNCEQACGASDPDCANATTTGTAGGVPSGAGGGGPTGPGGTSGAGANNATGDDPPDHTLRWMGCSTAEQPADRSWLAMLLALPFVWRRRGSRPTSYCTRT